VNRDEFDLSDPDAAMFCPACGAGYTAGRSRCADCDRELLGRSEIEKRLRAVEPEPEPSTEEEPSPEEPPSQLPEFDLSDCDAMSFCPACGSGYRAGPATCSDCGTELKPRSWVEARLELGSEESLDSVRLADIENSFKADVLGSALRDLGIRFVTQPTGWAAVRFLVPLRELDLARQVLADVDEMEESPPPET
jgi:hypothetical protein